MFNIKNFGTEKRGQKTGPGPNFRIKHNKIVSVSAPGEAGISDNIFFRVYV